MKLDIPELHEKVFLNLTEKRKKDSELRFSLRSNNIRSRIEKGYWFEGTEEYLELSFWAGYDWMNKSASIAFICDFSGYDCILRFSALDSEYKADFFRKLAKAIPGMKQIKQRGKSENQWEKHYYGREYEDYLENLTKFYSCDKPLIDNFLQYAIELNDKRHEDVNFYSEIDFQNMLSVIESNRNKQLESNAKTETLISKLTIKKITLQNIGCFNDLHIEFNDRITCIIGENGTGKTTLMRSIALAISGTDETDLIDTDNEKIKSLLRIVGIKDKHTHYAPKGAIKINYLTDKEYQNTIVFEDKGLKGVNISDGEDSAFAATRGELLKCLIVAFPQSQDKGQEPIYLRRIDEPNLGDLLPLIYGTPDERVELFSDWLIKLYNLYTENIAKGRKANEINIITDVFLIISEITGSDVKFKTVDIEDNQIWISTKDAPNGIKINLVSEGYQNIIGWFGFLTMRLQRAYPDLEDYKKGNAIVLLDEIDTFLHPRWQFRIIDVLLKFFPNTQFIITTHSPLIVSNLSKEQLYLLENVEDRTICYSPQFNPYGASISRVLQTIMKTDEHPIPNNENKISE